MRNCVLTAVSAAACLLGGASAQARTTAPAAIVARPITPLAHHLQQRAARESNLLVYTNDSSNMAWYGQGSAVKTIALCISSTTGRYRLMISSSRGGAAHGKVTIPYTIVFTDGIGGQTTASTEHSSIVAFDGSVPVGADCLSGPNASIQIKLDERSLLSSVAGTYADRLQFHVQTE
jgi:hypothetical protein